MIDEEIGERRSVKLKPRGLRSREIHVLLANVVIAAFGATHRAGFYRIDEPMLLIDPSRPDSAADVLQRLGLTGSGKRRPANLVDEPQNRGALRGSVSTQ